MGPSSKSISSALSARATRISSGHAVAPLAVIRPYLARDALAIVERARLVDQHDGDAVAYRVGQASLLAHQLVASAVVAQPGLGQRADQQLQQPRVGGRLADRHRHSLVLPATPVVNGARWSRRIRPAPPSPSARSAAAPDASRRPLRATPASPPARTGRSCTAK